MKVEPSITISSAALLSSLGCSVDELRSNLSSGHRGLSYSHRFSDRIASPLGEIPWESLGITVQNSQDSDRLLRMGSAKVLEQLGETSGVFRKHAKSKIGLFVGTTTTGIDGFFHIARQLETTGRSLDSLLKSEIQQAQLAHELAQEFHIQGPVYTFSASCAASAQAFIMAHDAVKMGWVDAAIVLGVDVLNRVTLHGFDALQLLDAEFCQPFTELRAGINLSEAIVGLLLERSEDHDHSMATRVRSFATLSEGHHMTQPAPEGLWMRLCMEKALSKAGLVPQDITYLNPHGTGTLANDEGEAKAIAELFGSTARVDATKRVTGHTLGASGALELLITMVKLEEQSSDPFQKAFGLKNSFGFGGVNVSIVLERGNL